MSDASFELELQSTFLTEAEEMLEDTEAAFVAIEASPSDASRIDKIFRLVHTIKGSAHMVGFVELGQFAHIFETLLGALRENKLNVTPEVVDILLEGNDLLKNFVRSLRNDRSAHIDAGATEDRIKGVLSVPQKEEVVKPLPQDSKGESSRVAIRDSALKARINRKEEHSLDPIFLVVDDEQEILKLVEEALRNGGYQVVTASSALDALKIFNSQSIDVIFTDLRMPVMDGIEFANVVRKHNEFVPIAFISGHSSRQHFKEFLKLGVDSFIEKPFDNDDILYVAQRVLRQGRLHSSMLTLSKLSFQAYVTVEKILSTLPLDESHEVDKEALDHCMTKMQQATTNLLASERQLKERR